MSVKKEKIGYIFDTIKEKKTIDETVDLDMAVSYIWGLFTSGWQDDLATTFEELDVQAILWEDLDSANEFGIKSAEDVLCPSNSMYKAVLYIFSELGVDYRPTRYEFQLYFNKIYDMADGMISHERAELRAKHFLNIANNMGLSVLPVEYKQTGCINPSLIDYDDGLYDPAAFRTPQDANLSVMPDNLKYESVF